jgi:hypothetical protein
MESTETSGYSEAEKDVKRYYFPVENVPRLSCEDPESERLIRNEVCAYIYCKTFDISISFRLVGQFSFSKFHFVTDIYIIVFEQSYSQKANVEYWSF